MIYSHELVFNLQACYKLSKSSSILQHNLSSSYAQRYHIIPGTQLFLLATLSLNPLDGLYCVVARSTSNSCSHAGYSISPKKSRCGNTIPQQHASVAPMYSTSFTSMPRPRWKMSRRKSRLMSVTSSCVACTQLCPSMRGLEEPPIS